MLNEPKQITDGGPWYAETHITDNLIVEPWNAISSLAIVAPGLYFLWKIRKTPLKHGFLLWCTPLLFLNGLGSTLFHGFRASRGLLMMDWLPAMLVSLSVTVYFWVKVLPKGWMAVFIAGLFIFLRVAIFNYFSGTFAINLSYTITGIAFLLPVVLILRKYGYAKATNIACSVICFILAIYFRRADKEFTHIIPFGTHFLWHIFTGVGAWLLADYLYFLGNSNQAPKGCLWQNQKLGNQYN